MDKKQLRLFTEFLIYDSDMSGVRKLKHLDFIHNEATLSQIKAYIMDGDITYLDEQAEQIVNDRFKLHEVKVDKKYREFEPKIKKFLKYGLAAIAGLGGASILTMAFLYVYRHMTDKCVQDCGGQTATKECYHRCYLKAAQEVLGRINKEISNINKVPQEKRAKVMAKLQKEKAIWEEKVRKYKMRIT